MGKAVVLGGYGLIGWACVRALREAGFAVVGVGRSAERGRRADPLAAWVAMDLGRATAEDFARLLDGASVVVNAAGALQDGLRDDLAAIHEGAVAALVAAMRGRGVRLVQVSAAGAREDASTEFLRSKARGDRLVREGAEDWVILRPALVLAPAAYGGTALLRGAAGLPLLRPRILRDSPVQTVWVGDVAQAVVLAATGRIAAGTVADLAEEESRPLDSLIEAMRDWLGLPPWRGDLPVPRALLHLLGRGADALGWLGWRSPLRTTALRVLEEGVTGDPATWAAAGGPPCRGLADTLERMPATAQERWFARLWPLLPLGVATLALFWIASGLIGLGCFESARAVLTERGLPGGPAGAAVAGGAVLDLLLGLAVLVRPWARAACLGMAGVSGAYLLGGTILAADLWADPLGPLLKVLPGATLALVVAAMLEER